MGCEFKDSSTKHQKSDNEVTRLGCVKERVRLSFEQVLNVR